MHFYKTRLILTLLYTTLLISCEKLSSNQEKHNTLDWKITQRDTTALIQSVLNHKKLDSLLNFAFKGQALKIVKNDVIRQPLKLTMNGMPVEFIEIDSSRLSLNIYNKPKFFGEITILKTTTSEVKLVIFFESIGLFGEYWLKKSQEGFWEIQNFNFART